MKKSSCLLLASFALIAACKTSKETSTATPADTKTPAKSDCGATVYTYTVNIKPILNESCNGCHGPEKKRGGLDFTIDEVLYGEARSSKLVCAVKQEKGCAAMPAYNPKLSDDKIKMIECWVNSGMNK
jgi:mono/diheme cytochrome c family protein